MVIALQHVSRGNRSRSLHLVLRRSSVHARLPQTLSAAAVMCALAAGGAAAQAPSPPQVSVGALTYLQYVYQLKDTANHLNNFEVTRAYINVNARLSNGVTARITPDVFRTLTGLSFRLKYAFVTYTPTASPLTFKLGQMHTPWLEWEEAVWDYRMQGSMALDRNGYLSASDLGAGVDGKWGPDKVNLQVTAVNGEDFKSSAGDQRKDVMGRVSVRVLDTDDSSRVGGLRITAYGQYGKPTGGGERQRLLGMVSYRTKHLTLAGEALVARDSVTAPVTVEQNGHLFTAFGVYKVPASKVAVLARVDIWHKQAGATDKQTRIIGGVSYQLSPNWRLLGDWDYVNYQTDPLNTANDATRSQALFQTQFTF